MVKVVRALHGVIDPTKQWKHRYPTVMGLMFRRSSFDVIVESILKDSFLILVSLFHHELRCDSDRVFLKDSFLILVSLFHHEIRWNQMSCSSRDVHLVFQIGRDDEKR